jgi:polyisoprenoid-binding protein YceI
VATTNDPSQNPVVAGPTAWEIDQQASHFEFTARQRLLFVLPVTVKGSFTDVSGTLTVDESEPTNSRAAMSIRAASLSTNQAAIDRHLRSPDFFEVDRYPTLSFTTQHIEVLDQATGHYRVLGTLTIRDKAREISLDVWNVRVPGDSRRLKFRLTAQVDRREFGLVWKSAIQRVADDVQIEVSVEFTSVSAAV